mmetsp:Transcript_130671/g.279401  ORF Transcript_130671/g.279401 Transcript_130671/m.279401 type:complete len:324 (+) Transcript_130671:100-1071(+)
MKLWASCALSMLAAYVAMAHPGPRPHLALQARALAAASSLKQPKSLTDLPPLYTLSESKRKEMRSRLLCLLKRNLDLSGLRLRSTSEPEGQLLPKVHGTCAVVSSSGVLKEHSHGKDIDTADRVIRFNFAPIFGHTEQVGKKDDLRFVNEKVLDMWNHMERLDMLRNDKTYSASCTLCDMGYHGGVSPNMYVNSVLELNSYHPEVKMYASDLKVEFVMKELLEQLYGLGPSPAGVTTGAVGMAVALSTCDEVRAYGMAQTQRSDGTAYHYWEPGSPQSTALHHRSFNAEKDLWRRLAANGPAEVELTDVAIIPGFSQVQCPAD